jgi:hypothetical protein
MLTQGRKNRTEMVQSLMIAYSNLVGKSAGAQIQRLEFQSFDEVNRQARPTRLQPALRVADTMVSYGTGTNRTKEMGRRAP